MLKLSLILISILCIAMILPIPSILALVTEEPELLWLEQFGTSSSDYGCGISVDGSGNVYLTGGTYGAFPGETNQGLSDVFIAFYPKLATIPEMIQDMIEDVESMNIQQGIENSLDSKLQNAQDSIEALNADLRNDAINKLEAFINAVEAQRGNKITYEQADYLIAEAQKIILLI